MTIKPIYLVPSILLIMLLLAYLLVWQAASPPIPETAADNRAEVAEINLRFGHNTPVNSALHLAAERFAEKVSRDSNGRVRVRVFPAQQLGNDHQMVEMARAGELDILLTPTAKMSVPVPAMQYADLPFYFPTREDLYTMLDGEPGRMLLHKLRAIGLVGVTFWENGFKHFTANRPLHRPQDFAGLNIRTMKSRLIMDQFRVFGANPIPIDFHATRQALADAVVDGQENPLIAITSMGFHEVQSDLTLSNHAYLGYVLSISAQVFHDLPQDLRAILITSGREITPWERAETHRREQKLLEQIRAAGVRVHILDESQREAFSRLTAHIPERYETVIGPDILSKTEEILREKYPAEPGQHLIIGLDADLSMDTWVSGLAIKRGARLAIDEINANGGVLGKSLELLVLDHGGQPSRGLSNIERLARNPSVVATLGGQHSSVLVAELPLLHDQQLPLLAAFSSAPGVVEHRYTPNFVFRASANNRLLAPFLAERLLQRYQRPAILAENSVWGESARQRLSAALAKHGVRFAAIESFNRGEQSLDVRLQRIERTGADVLVVIAKPLEAGILVRDLAQRAKPLPVISHWGIISDDFWQAHHDVLRKLDLEFFQTFLFTDKANPRARDLAQRYMQRYGVATPALIPAPSAVAQAYDLVHLLARAIGQAGSSERTAVRAALERLEPFQGVIREYAPAFTAERHEALDASDYHLARFAADGAIVQASDTPAARAD
jgi:C4-dicarboxylate-binding protein DctP